MQVPSKIGHFQWRSKKMGSHFEWTNLEKTIKQTCTKKQRRPYRTQKPFATSLVCVKTRPFHRQINVNQTSAHRDTKRLCGPAPKAANNWLRKAGKLGSKGQKPKVLGLWKGVSFQGCICMDMNTSSKNGWTFGWTWSMKMECRHGWTWNQHVFILYFPHARVAMALLLNWNMFLNEWTFIGNCN